MATAPRRETLIALRARHTAHRVASDARVHMRSRLKAMLCTCCGREFAAEADETVCSACRAATDAAPVAKYFQPPELIGEIYDDSYRDRARRFVFIVISIIAAALLIVCWSTGLLKGW